MTTAAAETIQHSKCLRCGRTLTAAGSRMAGYGAWCRRRVEASIAATPLDGHGPQARELAAEALRDGAVVPVACRFGDQYQVVSSHRGGRRHVYRTTADGWCDCSAKQRGVRCWHAAAVAILRAA